jgi:signal transduction histidine kinase
LSIVAIAVSLMLQGSRDKLALARLDEMTRPIYVQFTTLSAGQTSWTEVIANLREQARQNNIYILLLDNTGKVTNQITPTGTQGGQLIEVQPDEIPAGISSPERGIFETTDGQTFIYSAYPIGRAVDTRVASRFNTLVLAAPRGRIIAIGVTLVRPLLQAGFIALGISTIIAIVLARSIYHPVQRVSQAAERIAQGRYDQEIPIAGPKEIKGLAMRFNEMTRKVKESQQQLRHFVADVSHQLKTPLTSIQGFTQAILDGTAQDSDTRERAVEVIDEESKRMIRQVNELLELSRMQAGQLQMTQELVDIKELLLHCQEIFSLRAEEKGIRLTTQIEPLTPVTGDADRLEQVFINLLDNAIKNTPAQGEVSIIAHNNADNSVQIAVADNGPGIPPEQLPHVFERFYQAGGLRTGTGLGLAIAREIVLAHSGRIEASSEPGALTKFMVTLPTATAGGQREEGTL